MRLSFRHTAARRQVDRLINRGLPHRRHLRLWEHLRDCADCRGYYESLRDIEEAISLDDTLSQPAIERLASLVVPTIAPAVAEERSAVRWLVVAVGAATLAIIAGLWLPESIDGSLAVRGGAGPGVSGLSVFRIDTRAHAVERLARHPSTVVRSGDVIQLAYHNGVMAAAFVLGLDARGEIQWYHPRDTAAEPGGVILNQHVADEPFGLAWTIAAPPGPLRLFAVFTDGSVVAEDVRAAALRASRGGVRLTELERLPGLTAAQDSLLLEVVP